MPDKSIAGRPIVFRCDGSSEIGLGHMIRCLALADHFKPWGAGPIQFVSRRFSSTVAARVEGAGYPIKWLEPQLSIADDLSETLETCRSNASTARAALIITDSHELPEDYYIGLKAAGLLVVSVDDYAAARYASDLVVNHHLNASEYTFWIGPSTRLLLGPRYLPLRRQFRTYLETRRTVRDPRRIIISLGGMPDPDHLSCVLAGIEEVLKRRSQITVTVTPGYRGMTEDQRKRMNVDCPGVELLDPNEDLVGAFASSDLAVVNGSLTAYEAAALGLPLIMIGMDRNQWDAVRGFEAAGACLALPPIEQLEPRDVGDALDRLLAHPSLMASLGQRGRALVDGQGADRIVAEAAELCSDRDGRARPEQPPRLGFFRPVMESARA